MPYATLLRRSTKEIRHSEKSVLKRRMASFVEPLENRQLLSATQVNLTSYFTAFGIGATGGKATIGFDGAGNRYVSTQIGASVTFGGNAFKIGPAGVKDIVQKAGTTVTLPAGKFGSLSFLAAATNGSQPGQTFTVHYSDKTSQTFSQDISDWIFTSSFTGESVAKSMGLELNAAGNTVTPNSGMANVYGYTLPLNASKTVSSITLPNNANVGVLAIDLTPSPLVVTTTADTASGVGSLREAIIYANTLSTPSTITFNLGAGAHTINLGSELPQISSNVTISGPGANLLTVQRNSKSNFRILEVAAGKSAVISGITLANGHATDVGGAVRNEGSLTVVSCTLSNNYADVYGGGIYNDDTLVLSDDTFAHNTGVSAGGAVSNQGNSVTATNCTFVSNMSGDAGGIFNVGNVTTLSDCTFSGNSGGGIDNWFALTLNNTIIANSTGYPDVVNNSNGNGTSSGSNNLIGDGMVPAGLTHTITGNPKLGALAYNGGTTKTLALLAGSPAIDAGSNALVATGVTTDQRGTGFARIRGGSVDIGAIESTPLPPPVHVNLATSFSKVAVINNGTTTAAPGFDDSNDFYSGTLLGTSLIFHGNAFNLGPAGANDILLATGQKITLPGGKYTSLSFLASAYNSFTGEQNQTFKVTYTDGTFQTFTRSVSDWISGNAPFANETIAQSMAYRLKGSPAAQDTVTTKIYGYTLALNVTKTVASITLPNDSQIALFAMDLQK